jgi:hypothetical protein
VANLPEISNFDPVYRVETFDYIGGGLEGTQNKPIRNLVNRTRWLKERMEKLIIDVDYILPPATRETLGGIKAGFGFYMSCDGTLQLSYMPPAPPTDDGGYPTMPTNVEQLMSMVDPRRYLCCDCDEESTDTTTTTSAPVTTNAPVTLPPTTGSTSVAPVTIAPTTAAPTTTTSAPYVPPVTPTTTASPTTTTTTTTTSSTSVAPVTIAPTTTTTTAAPTTTTTTTTTTAEPIVNIIQNRVTYDSFYDFWGERGKWYSTYYSGNGSLGDGSYLQFVRTGDTVSITGEIVESSRFDTRTDGSNTIQWHNNGTPTGSLTFTINPATNQFVISGSVYQDGLIDIKTDGTNSIIMNPGNKRVTFNANFTAG